MQKCFDDKDIQMLQEVITKMDPTVSSFLKLLKFCDVCFSILSHCLER